MLKIYGSMQCPDCVKCREDLTAAGVEFAFLDFEDSLLNLKEFLKIRDTSPLFDRVRQEGKIGIPCIVKEDSTLTLSWDTFM